jgi:hypothetical protein
MLDHDRSIRSIHDNGALAILTGDNDEHQPP